MNLETKNQESMTEMNKKINTSSKKIEISKDNILFTILIIITFLAGSVITIKSKKYNKFLKEQNSSYYYPSLFEIFFKTFIYTFILLIPKVLFEK